MRPRVLTTIPSAYIHYTLAHTGAEDRKSKRHFRPAATARLCRRIGSPNGIFAPPPPPASAGSRCSRAALAAPPARGGSTPQQRTARRGAAERSLDRRRKMGEGRASGVSGRQGLGTARWEK